MNRRDFLKGLAALTAVAASPTLLQSSVERWERRSLIENETFYLDRPLQLDMPDGFVIRNCRFVANPGFVGDCMVNLRSGDHGSITGCVFDLGGMMGPPTALAWWYT